MTLRYFLTDYTDESYPAEAPTLEAWAAWLADPLANGEEDAWGRDGPATAGEEFNGFVTAEVDRVTFTVGEEPPAARVGFDWCCVADEWEASGSTFEEAISCCDPGDEVEIICFKDTDRRFRFELIDGVPALLDTDPATVPASTEAVREQLQPSLL